VRNVGEPRRHLFDTFRHFWSEAPVNKGTLNTPRMELKAAPSLEGGLRSTLEGLDYSGFPCAGVLSVAGFLVTIGRFPPGREEYSEVRMDPFLPGKAGTVDVTHRSVTTPSNTAVMTVSRLAMSGMYRAGCVNQEGHWVPGVGWWYAGRREYPPGTPFLAQQ